MILISYRDSHVKKKHPPCATNQRLVAAWHLMPENTMGQLARAGFCGHTNIKII